MSKKSVMFIVEDDPTFNKLLTAYFNSRNKWEVHSFLTGEESLSKLHLKPVVWLQDFDLPGINGIQVMKKAKKALPRTGFIFLSGQGTIQVAVDSLKEGAFDYLVKDINSKENALNKVDQIMNIRRLEDDRKMSKIGFVSVSIILLISWVIFLILYS
jgi:DNA-binding NtrC family response regulator